jgi:hypothetical protein
MIDFDDLAKDQQQLLWSTCKDIEFCSAKFNLPFEVFCSFFHGEEVNTSLPAKNQVIELISTYTYKSLHNFCIGYNEVSYFNLEKNLWECRCKSEDTIHGCGTTDSINNTDTSNKVIVATLVIICILLLLITCIEIVKFLWSFWQVRKAMRTTKTMPTTFPTLLSQLL